MPWCPGCSYEYSGRKRKCPECGEALGKGPGFTETAQYMNREWYTVRILADSSQAELLRHFLENKAFEVALRNGNGVVQLKKRAKPTKVEVLVLANQAPKAANIIRSSKSWQSDDNSVHELVPPDDYTCDDDDVIYDDDEAYIESAVDLSSLSDFDYYD